MRTTAAALVFACAVGLLPAGARAESTPVRRTVERTAPAAAHVRVEDSIGDIQIVGDDGANVRVTAHSSLGGVRNAIGSANVSAPAIEAHTSVGDVIITTR